MKRFLLAPALLLALSACGGSDNGQLSNRGNSLAPSSSKTAGVLEVVPTLVQIQSDARQIHVEDSLVSAFENSTLELQYGYIEDIGDGNGYTAGRAGFTTRWGDMLDVINEYARLRPDAPLVEYSAALAQVQNTGSTAGLSDLETLWPLAAESDPLFIQAQDTVNETLSRQPAIKLAESLGTTFPLSRAAIYEAGIQHGYGFQYYSINKIAERATSAVGGTPKDGVSELVWLKAFLEERRRTLLAPGDEPVAEAWKASVERADVMLQLYESGNVDLSRTISFSVFGDSFTF